MKNIRKLTEGSVLLAIFSVLLLLTLYVPALGVLVNLFLPLPFILFAAKNTLKSSLLLLIAAILLSLIVGTFMAIPLTLTYGAVGVVTGYLIQKQKSRWTIFVFASLMFLMNVVLQYAVAAAFFKFNIIAELLNTVRKSMQMSAEILKGMGQKNSDQIIDQMESGIKMAETLMPSMFVIVSFVVVFIIQSISLPIVKRFGVKTADWKPIREISLPKSLLWYYLLASAATMLINPQEGSYWFWALANLMYILQLSMVVQGITFIFYFSHVKGYAKAVPVSVAILSFLLPFLLYIVRILGIIDLGFDLRKRVKKNV